MTKTEKKQWLKAIMNSVRDKLTAQVDKMPDEWDAVELRELLADVFVHDRDAWGKDRRPRGSRKTAYERAKARINY